MGKQSLTDKLTNNIPGQITTVGTKILPYVVLGHAAISGFVMYQANNEYDKISEQINESPYHNEIVQYENINSELEQTLTVNELFNDQTINQFSQLATKRDSIRSLEGFDSARKNYVSLQNQQNKAETAFWSGVLGLSMSALVGIFTLGYRPRSEEEDNRIHK